MTFANIFCTFPKIMAISFRRLWQFYSESCGRFIPKIVAVLFRKLWVETCLHLCRTLRNSLLSQPRDDREKSERWARQKMTIFRPKTKKMTHLNTFYTEKFAHVKIFPYLCRRICICVFFTHLHVRCHHAEWALCLFGAWQYLRHFYKLLYTDFEKCF